MSAASEMLGVSEPHFHRLRERALTGAAEALEPRPAGRPAILRTASDERVAELEEKLEQMKLELHASQVREQIAVLMPHLLLPAGESKKKLQATPLSGCLRRAVRVTGRGGAGTSS